MILSSTLAFQLVVVECYFVIHTISSLEALKIASQAGSQSGSQSLTHFISVDAILQCLILLVEYPKVLY